MSLQPVWIDGCWRPADAVGSFRALDPSTGEALEQEYPISSRADVEAAIVAGAGAAPALEAAGPEAVAAFLERYAALLQERAETIATAAARETALPLRPRLAEVEMGRTVDQLRQAAAAARDRGWCLPTIDTRAGVRSRYGPLGGPVVVFGPNNFPLAFNGVAGGDFAAAIATGNPVIAKAHPSHPRTCQLLAEAAAEAVADSGLPPASVQLLYRISHEDGAYLVSHPAVGATGYTGSRAGGLALKRAADAAGKPIYLEMSSVNPVFMLPGALRERAGQIADELQASALLGCGQFCTNPGLVVLPAGAAAAAFVAEMVRRFEATAPGVLLAPSGVANLDAAVARLRAAGAELLTGGAPAEGPGCRYRNTVLRVTGSRFLQQPEALQTEAFGNAVLFVIAEDAEQMERIAAALEGNLTGTVYTHSGGDDDARYERLARLLRRRVGRLLNDKMPTGVAVSPAMNHGGPFPATGHPGFTAVGIPASLRRFAMLECYDNVREQRLPAELRDANPTGRLWRFVDGEWTRADVGGAERR